ncbi:MAG: hypothetical protein MSS53_10215 [Oscillibacter sp.]|nr:hypothetical protein [Oscillibacter sp.]MDY3079302.1 hypothetical protein [Oscillospiraceae bacterium]
MAKASKIMLTIALIALILGALCILVGIITGGDFERVKNVFYAVYDIENRVNGLNAFFTFIS